MSHKGYKSKRLSPPTKSKNILSDIRYFLFHKPEIST
ncbi:MAG: hypothetical protein ACI81W_003211, partial [Saprospiraceae bacterium]